MKPSGSLASTKRLPWLGLADRVVVGVLVDGDEHGLVGVEPWQIDRTF